MPERSKGEVLRTFVLNHSWVRTPLAAYRFHSVEVSTLDFDSNIPGSNPGGTFIKFFIITASLAQLVERALCKFKIA